jgi:hypothetical protein
MIYWLCTQISEKSSYIEKRKEVIKCIKMYNCAPKTFPVKPVHDFALGGGMICQFKGEIECSTAFFYYEHVIFQISRGKKFLILQVFIKIWLCSVGTGLVEGQDIKS